MLNIVTSQDKAIYKTTDSLDKLMSRNLEKGSLLYFVRTENSGKKYEMAIKKSTILRIVPTS